MTRHQATTKLAPNDELSENSEASEVNYFRISADTQTVFPLTEPAEMKDINSWFLFDLICPSAGALWPAGSGVCSVLDLDINSLASAASLSSVKYPKLFHGSALWTPFHCKSISCSHQWFCSETRRLAERTLGKGMENWFPLFFSCTLWIRPLNQHSFRYVRFFLNSWEILMLWSGVYFALSLLTPSFNSVKHREQFHQANVRNYFFMCCRYQATSRRAVNYTKVLNCAVLWTRSCPDLDTSGSL